MDSLQRQALPQAQSVIAHTLSHLRTKKRLMIAAALGGGRSSRFTYAKCIQKQHKDVRMVPSHARNDEASAIRLRYGGDAPRVAEDTRLKPTTADGCISGRSCIATTAPTECPVTTTSPSLVLRNTCNTNLRAPDRRSTHEGMMPLYGRCPWPGMSHDHRRNHTLEIYLIWIRIRDHLRAAVRHAGI